MSHRSISIFCLTLLAGGAGLAFALSGGETVDEDAPTSGPSRARALASAYSNWEAKYEAAGGDRARVMTLLPSQAFQSAPTDAWGQVELNLVDGQVKAGLVGTTAAMDLWIVDNVEGEGRSARPEAGDVITWLGRLEPSGGAAVLEAPLPAGATVDLAVMTPAGVRPEDDPALVGYATLFHRLYDRSHEQPLQVLADREDESRWREVFGFASAEAATAPSNPSLEQLIAQGERLFNRETFKGNGRTCASCHPVLHNTTIDQGFVASRKPYDPLLIAEFNPKLATLEDPALMREFALIKENQDGMDDLDHKFNMRGVPHTLAMPTSLDVFFFDDQNEIESVVEAIGWSGDGSTNGATPADGALRDFANGAINQHFPKTLNRKEGYDFRLATDLELDAMEAFQLSLGRQEELDLTTMFFKNPKVEEGKEVFDARKCGFCHQNAGANDIGIHPFGGRLAGGNLNLNTGVENVDLDQSFGDRPRDGGFGREFDIPTPLNPFFDQDPVDGVVDELFSGPLLFDCSVFPHTSQAFGDGAFNITSLVEAADTPPFFHNNAFDDLEDAVAFYGTAPFNCSPGGRAVGQIVFEDGDVEKITAFLRAINALENIRASLDYTGDAKVAKTDLYAKGAIDGALAETEDAIQVLNDSAIHSGDAVKSLNKAVFYLKIARRLSDYTGRAASLESAKKELDRAKAYILE